MSRRRQYHQFRVRLKGDAGAGVPIDAKRHTDAAALFALEQDPELNHLHMEVQQAHTAVGRWITYRAERTGKGWDVWREWIGGAA